MRIVKVLLLASIVIVCLLGFLVYPGHESHYFWERIPVFEAVFGFVGCIVLIIVAKILGRFFLERREDYYD
jgi:hypothetical protein